MNKIEIKNLSKSFGKVNALNNITLDIEVGVFGLLGRNGAGKTTFIKILSTLLNKDSGDIKICGTDIKNTKYIRNIIGYLPQEFSLYPNMTVYEIMDYLGILSNMSTKLRKERIPFILKKVNLYNYRNFKFRALSGGMKRRLGIAQSILHNPKVLIVDEPTVGLDLEERVNFRKLLSDIAEDRIVILSTHIVGDIEETCNQIGVMDKGEMLYCGEVKDFIRSEKNLESAYMKYMEEKNGIY